MIIEIPEWVLWCVGLPAGLVLIAGIGFFAYMGWLLMSCMDFRR